MRKLQLIMDKSGTVVATNSTTDREDAVVDVHLEEGGAIEEKTVSSRELLDLAEFYDKFTK